VDKAGWKQFKSQLDKPTQGYSLLHDPDAGRHLASVFIWIRTTELNEI